jgi:hypothetical protein
MCAGVCLMGVFVGFVWFCGFVVLWFCGFVVLCRDGS